MARCGCGSTCTCVITGTGVTGSGSVTDPYVVTGATQYTDEMARDAVGAALVEGAGIDITVNDVGDTITVASTITQYTDEQVRDVIGAALVAGSNITITPNDGSDIITIAGTVSQYTDEMARDAIGTALVAGSNVTITVNDAGDTITIAATGGGGGSGITQSYLGRNSVGATTEAFVANRVYLKKVTLATAGMMNSIEAHLKDGGGGQVASFLVALFADNSGAPGKVLFIGGGTHINNSFIADTTAGWVGSPVGAWLAAGDYWIAVDLTDNGSLVIYLDTTGGTDRYYDPGNVWIADSSLETVNTTTKNYSIRASITR